MKKTIAKACVCTMVFVLAGVLIGFIRDGFAALYLIMESPVLLMIANHIEELSALVRVISVFYIWLFIQEKYWIFEGSNGVKRFKKGLLFLYGLFVTGAAYWLYFIFSYWLTMRNF